MSCCDIVASTTFKSGCSYLISYTAMLPHCISSTVMRILLSVVKSTLAATAVAFALPGSARADFVPVPLTPGSFNQDIVVEKTAPIPVIPGGYTTASMDGGINNNGDTWNETGFFVDNPDVGLPKAG